MNPRQMEEDIKIVCAWVAGWTLGAVATMITFVVVALILAR
jgi:hypothetical protein